MWRECWKWPLPEKPHAKWFLEEIKARGFHLRALSKRGDTIAREASCRELARHGLLELFDGIYFIGLEDDEPTKGEILRQWNAKFFIDDAFENVFDSVKKSPRTEVFLMDASYNQSQDIDPPYLRVSTLQEVFNYIDSIDSLPGE